MRETGLFLLLVLPLCWGISCRVNGVHGAMNTDWWFMLKFSQGVEYGMADGPGKSSFGGLMLKVLSDLTSFMGTIS